jgi:hypothetical protein
LKYLIDDAKYKIDVILVINSFPKATDDIKRSSVADALNHITNNDILDLKELKVLHHP